MGWDVELRDNDNTVVLTAGLELSPVFYSARAVGGPDVAEIQVEGGSDAMWSALNWLGYGTVIRNPKGNAVWWGHVVGVSIGLGAAAVGRTLEEMANRVIVDYTLEESGVGQVRRSTAWGQDARSVAQYGAKEERLSLADATSEQAEALRDVTLAKRGKPVATMAMGGESGARLICHGLWRSLGWQVYQSDAGREEHAAASDVEQMLGWGLPANTYLGFNGKRMDDLLARLASAVPGNRIRVSGSALNDGVYTISSAGDADQLAITYATGDIIFEEQDDIQDNHHGLAFARMEHMLYIYGASNGANNGIFWVTKEHNYRIEVMPGIIENETPVGPITILQGHALTVTQEFTRERGGASVSISALGSKLAQGFRLGSAASWTVKRAQVRVRKVGTPADNLRLSIHASSGGTVGAQIASAIIAGSAVKSTMDWVAFDFGAGVALTAGTNYFLVLERTGADSTANVYVAGLESAMSYPRGNLLIWDGGAWTTRTPDAQMPFMLADAVETTTQIGSMVADAQFMTGVDIKVASGVSTCQWRDGEQSILTEVERLLETGTQSGGSLLARVTLDGRVVVEAEATPDELRFMLDGEGVLQEPLLGKAEEGVLPVGQWVGLSGTPSQLSEEARFFVESAEYDVVGARLRLEPRAGQE